MISEALTVLASSFGILSCLGVIKFYKQKDSDHVASGWCLLAAIPLLIGALYFSGIFHT